MKRLNKYVNFMEVEDGCFIFDISSSTAIAVHPEIFNLIKDHYANIEEIQAIHPDLYESLVMSKVIVDSDCDETQMLRERYNAIDCDPSSFSIIVNPTLECNLRCWYCYENHKKQSRMTDETLSAIKKLIATKTNSPELKNLLMSFFGGEPILGWNNVVRPLLKYSVDKCNERGINFSTAFTTNGVLLTDEKTDMLLDLGLKNTSFQITIDGNRTFHDFSRIGASKAPTYDVIMRNVEKTALKGFTINLRFNYTPDTIDSFIDVLSDIKNMPVEAQWHIRCSFEKVWQSGNEDTRNQALSVIHTFQNAGISTSSDILYNRHHCYADRENNIVVNYNGDIFKCTAREFSPSAREGILNRDGTLSLNERYHKRMALKYSSPICKSCSIMPLCNGHCSQSKLERELSDSCPMGYDESSKKDVLIGALYQTVFNKTIELKKNRKIVPAN